MFRPRITHAGAVCARRVEGHRAQTFAREPPRPRATRLPGAPTSSIAGTSSVSESLFRGCDERWRCNGERPRRGAWRARAGADSVRLRLLQMNICCDIHRVDRLQRADARAARRSASAFARRSGRTAQAAFVAVQVLGSIRASGHVARWCRRGCARRLRSAGSLCRRRENAWLRRAPMDRRPRIRTRRVRVRAHCSVQDPALGESQSAVPRASLPRVRAAHLTVNRAALETLLLPGPAPHPRG